MEDGTGMFVEEVDEVETRDYGSGAQEDFSGIVFCSRFFNAVDMADIVACFPFQWKEILFNETWISRADGHSDRG